MTVSRRSSAGPQPATRPPSSPIRPPPRIIPPSPHRRAPPRSLGRSYLLLRAVQTFLHVFSEDSRFDFRHDDCKERESGGLTRGGRCVCACVCAFVCVGGGARAPPADWSVRVSRFIDTPCVSCCPPAAPGGLCPQVGQVSQSD